MLYWELKEEKDMASSLTRLSLQYRDHFIGVVSIKQKTLITEVYMECIGNKYFINLRDDQTWWREVGEISGKHARGMGSEDWIRYKKTQLRWNCFLCVMRNIYICKGLKQNQVR